MSAFPQTARSGYGQSITIYQEGGLERVREPGRGDGLLVEASTLSCSFHDSASSDFFCCHFGFLLFR